MKYLENMSINIAQDPAKAISQISDPILQVIDAKTSHHETELKSQQMDKLRKQKRIIELRQQLLDERFMQINTRREIEDQLAETGNL